MHSPPFLKGRGRSCQERPAPLVRTLLLAAVAAGLGVAVAGWLDAPSRESWPGIVDSHRRPVTAAHEATLIRWLVAEGRMVQPGAAIAILRDESISEQQRKLDERIRTLEGKLAQARARASVEIEWRLGELRAEIHATHLKSAELLQIRFDRQLEHQAAVEGLGSDEIRGARSPHADGVFRPVSFPSRGETAPDWSDRLVSAEAALNAAEVASVQIGLCESRLAALEFLASELPGAIRSAEGVDRLEAALDEVQTQRQALDRQPREVEVRSPAWGTVGTYRRRPGERLSPGALLVELLDPARRFVLVRVPSADVPRFSEGGRVEVTFAGDVVRQGCIGPVASQVDVVDHDRMGADESVGDPTTLATPGITLRIEPSGKLWPDVPLGTAVEVRLGPAKSEVNRRPPSASSVTRT